MSAGLFNEYEGYSERDGVVAAAVVQEGQMRQLSQITGGTAVMRKIRGGSMQLLEILLHGQTAKMGDYILALSGNVFVVMKKNDFEEKYKFRGPLRIPVI